MTNKIDWKNHVIAFFSAMLGILIAFQLEDYRDNRQEKEKLRVTLNAIKKEIENNRTIYQTNINRLSDFLEYFELRELTNEKGELKLTKDKFERMKAKHPDRFRNWILLKQQNDSSIIFDTHWEFTIDTAPETGVSTSSWQAGLYEGILNRLDNNTLSQLTQIYEWVGKDIGLNEREFYENLTLSDITKIDPLIAHYKKIIAVQQFKLDIINKHYFQIDWSEK
jgi:hypothetical protein